MMLTLYSFNPYFTGSNSGSYLPNPVRCQNYLVSILILLEVILEAWRQLYGTYAYT